MSKNNKSKSKSKSKSQANVGEDMFENLFNDPIVQSNYPGPSQPTGFANFAPIAQPFRLAPDDPRNNYQHQGWYQNQQFSYSPQFSQNRPYSPPYPNFSQNQQFSPTTPYFQQSNFSLPETQTVVESSDEAEPEPETETVPETQAADEKGKRKQVRWTDEEARILAERWIHCSENGVQGNNQTNDSFWRQVQQGYNSIASVKRNLNSLTGKWNKISYDVKVFQGIYKKFTENLPQSGANDEDVLNAARKGFKQQMGKRKFIYEQCWDVLKHYPKFFAEEGVMGSARTQFQPEVDPIDLNEDFQPMPTVLEANMKRLFRDDLIRRPAGRKSAKSSVSSDAASSSRSVHSEKIETLKAVKDTALLQQNAINTITKNNIKKAAYKALSFLCKKIPKNASKKELKMIKSARKEVVEQYEDVYGKGDSDEDEPETQAANDSEGSSSS